MNETQVQVRGQGPLVDAMQLQQTLDHVFRVNDTLRISGGQPRPVCIWGRHGIGKTQIIRDYSTRRGWDFAYCAPAQFEEMGDFHGLPVVRDDRDDSGIVYTGYAPPAWIPRQEGPGILLLDDINRADERILRGIMQLLQNGELFSWGLPEGWHIIATANPDNSDYSVTPMDDAMLTRMMHLSLEFEPRAWALWASASGIDRRCIDFVLLYPEVINGKKTTPRTLVDFFHQISEIEDFAASGDLVVRIGEMSLEPETVEAFLCCVFDDLPRLVSPEQILTAEDPTPSFEQVEAIIYDDDGSFRSDRMSIMLTRIYLSLLHSYVPVSQVRKSNLVSFLLAGFLPADMRLSFWKDMVATGRPELRELIQDPHLANAIMGERRAS